MSRRLLLSLLVLLAPLCTSAEERREAIIILDEPALVEKFIASKPGQHLRRERLASREADDELLQMRTRKAAIKAAMHRTGVEFTGDTEVVLNAVMVRATPSQLEALRQIPGVKSAEFGREFELLMDGALPLIHANEVWGLPAVGGEENAGRGVKIAVIDSGIDQTHPMLQDGSLTAPSGYPKFGVSADRALTTGKVIVARNFTPEANASDQRGHGTFVASVAAGRRVNAEVPNGPTISISGVAPKAYLGNYKVFTASGSANESSVTRAIEQAVLDGMDIVNLSLGSSNAVEPSRDASASAVRNAVASGVLVVAAVGNSGPGVRSIGSPATLPNVLSVGATTNARTFFGVVRLTSTAELPNELRTISGLPGNEPHQTSTFGPGRLIDITRLDDTRLGCPPGSDGSSPVTLPAGSLSGKVALVRRGQCFFKDKVRNAANAGAAGVVIYNNLPDSAPLFMDTAGSQVPSISIGNREGEALEAMLQAGATIDISFDPHISARPDTPDIVAAFSSRGPVPGADMKVKPDVMAPGQYIAAAVERINPQGELFTATGYSLERGTSFSSPMAAGAAALVRQARPGLTPEQLKSLLVNTADPVTRTEDGVPVNAQIVGAGRMNVLSAVNGTMAADPVSLSFAARSPRSTFSETQFVKITNVGSASDTLTLAIVPRAPLANFTAAVQPSQINLAAGASTQVAVTLSNSGTVQAVADGMLNVRSNNTGASINVPYWVTFLVPEVNSNGVVNAASFEGRAVAPGSIVSIFGLSLASQQKIASSLPLGTELGGSKVELNSKAIPLFFTSAGQLNAQIPYDTAFGSFGSLRVSVDGNTGGNLSLQVNQFAPGLFTQSSDGRGIGAMLHADNSLITPANPARPGETIVLYGTGLGPVDNPPALGRAAAADPLSFTTTAPVVFVGGKQARVQFSGLAPGFVGLYQVNVKLPTEVGTGDQPVVLTIGGVSSNTVTVPLR